MLHNCITFHVSKELGIVRIEVVVNGKLVYCLFDVLGVHDELIWAYHRSLKNAADKRNWSRAAACSCESLRASGVIRTEPVKFKVLDTKSFGEYFQQYAVINSVECCTDVQQHQGRHKAYRQHYSVQQHQGRQSAYRQHHSGEWCCRYADCRAGNRPYWFTWTSIRFTTKSSTVLETKLRLGIGLYDLMSSGSRDDFLILGRTTACLAHERLPS